MVIHVFPGMGATKEMHNRLSVSGHDIKLYNWPTELDFNSFSDLAEWFVCNYQIKRGHIVAGSSMGGMIACEISKMLGGNKIILIGSCTSPRSIPMHGISKMASMYFSQGALRLVGLKGQISLLAKMANEVGPLFIKRSLLALYHWNGVNRKEVGEIASIHGLIDPIIPYYKEHHDKQITFGGHFIAISNPKCVSQFINNAAHQGDAPEPSSPAR